MKWQKLPGQVDIGGYMAGTVKPVFPTMLRRSDGKHLMYRGLINAMWGRPESGKSLICQHVSVEHMRAGGLVVYLDFEQGIHMTALRYQQLGLSAKIASGQLIYISTLTEGDVPTLIDNLQRARDEGVDVMFLLDSVDTLLYALGINPNDQSAGTALNNLLWMPFRNMGVTALIVDHVSNSKVPAKDRGPMGNTHKLSEVDLGIKAERLVTPVRGGEGRIRLFVDKDRHSTVREHSAQQEGTDLRVAGTAHISSVRDPDVIEVWVDPYTAGGATSAILPHWQIVLNALADAHPNGLHKAQLKKIITDEDPTTRADDPVKDALKVMTDKTTDKPYDYSTGIGYYLTPAGMALYAEVSSPPVSQQVPPPSAVGDTEADSGVDEELL